MNLTLRELALLAQAERFLQAQDPYGSIRPGELPPDLLEDLLRSDAADLPTVAFYLMSLLGVVIPHRAYVRDPRLVERCRPYLETVAASLAPGSTGLSVYSPSPSRFQTASRDTGIWESDANQSTAPPTSMTVIVHGTFARTETWWQPKGSFWSYVDSIRHDVYGGSDCYSWSGGNSHTDRLLAASAFKTWVDQHPAGSLDVIAHSHGVNVCLLASRLGVTIRKLICLASPVRLEYFPDLGKVDHLFNVFSIGDRVQTPWATYPNRRGEGRTFGDCECASNWLATDDGSGREPGHSELHEMPTWKASKLEGLLQ